MTGKPGVDGYGVIILPYGLELDGRTRIVKGPGAEESLVQGCLYECRIPARVRVEAEAR